MYHWPNQNGAYTKQHGKKETHYYSATAAAPVVLFPEHTEDEHCKNAGADKARYIFEWK